jgi:hypothetical protein
VGGLRDCGHGDGVDEVPVAASRNPVDHPVQEDASMGAVPL